MYKLGVIGVALLFPIYICAAEVRILTTDLYEAPLGNAVITLTPQVEHAMHQVTRLPEGSIEMVQQGKVFKPYVLPVHSGSPVSFPNKDDILHHVYSFSKAMSFEINLYAGTPVAPIVFDKPGIVALGCNIHDWMVGFIYVTDSPYFIKTDEYGDGLFRSIPEGKYLASIWHPRLKGQPDKHDQLITLTSQSSIKLGFKLPLKPEIRREPSEEEASGEYTAF